MIESKKNAPMRALFIKKQNLGRMMFMAITLQEAKIGMADKVDQQVVDMFRRNSLLLDKLVFDNVISPGTGGSTLTYGYIQLKSLPPPR